MATATKKQNPFVKKRKQEPSLHTTSTISTTTQAKETPNSFFNLVKRQKPTSTPSTSNEGNVSAKRKFIDTFAEVPSTSKSGMEKDKQRKVSCSTATENNTLASINVSRITVKDEVDIPWLSVNSDKSKETVVVKDEPSHAEEDSELKEFITSFRNCVVLKVKNLLAAQRDASSMISNNTTVNNGCNFKKFRKVRSVDTPDIFTSVISFYNNCLFH